jgi:predicted nuclease of restriction endonuclease-like (RecB) superfamily
MNTLLTSTLLGDVKQLIVSAKQHTFQAVNAQMTLLYWRVGHTIASQVLGHERASYGQQVVDALAIELSQEFGKGWSKRNLFQMIKFSEVFSDFQIVQTLSAQLSWSHFNALVKIDDVLKREFYLAMTLQERWSTRTLTERIDKQLFERTAISKEPSETIVQELSVLREQGLVNEALVLKDPYVFDFLGLKDSYLEADLEDAILSELQQFLLELGGGFSFMARQYRIQLDGDDFYIDLLFYNRKLKRLVAIDLKVGDFKAQYKGQMELYLRWLAKHEQEVGENPPLGIILCSGKKQEQIELLELDGAGIHVAEYLTALPPKAVLAERLHLAIRNAKQRFTLSQLKDENEYE